MSKGSQAGQSTAGSMGLPNVLPSIAPSLTQPSAAAIGAQNMQQIAKNSPGASIDLAKLIPQLQKIQDAAKQSAPQPLTAQTSQVPQAIHPQVLQMMLPYFMPRGKP